MVKFYELLDNSRYSEAAENLRLLILSYPNGTYTGDAYFWLGEIYLVQEMFEDSSEILNAFLAKFDDHPRKADGLYKLALAKVIAGQEKLGNFFAVYRNVLPLTQISF